ncbi:hypothetical protein MMC19_001584 [Ptychographa xylographoides]|nr:hypothetical protein [Ptychographa xylographoides]
MLQSLIRYGACRFPLKRLSRSVPFHTCCILSSFNTNAQLNASVEGSRAFHAANTATSISKSERVDIGVYLATNTRDSDVAIQEQVQTAAQDDNRNLEYRNRSSQVKVKAVSGETFMISSHTFRAHQATLENLQHQRPHPMLCAFLDASNDPDYLRILPTTTLTEIIRTIAPSYFLDPYKTAFRDFPTYHVDQLQRDSRQLTEVFSDYVRTLETLIFRYRRTGRTFGIFQYKTLLRTAHAVGDGISASAIHDAMRVDEVEPDTECWNLFLGARCWSNRYNRKERYRLRVVPWNMEMRQGDMSERRPGWKSYGVGERGLREETIRNFELMVKSGVMTNVDTFSILMLAMGREGDMEGVNTILKQIWDVDLETAMLHDDSALLFENKLFPTSPLYPSQDLLFTIAHIFGMNNDMPAALRMLDVFSRKYGILIDVETWSELLNWTYCLSSRKDGRARVNGSSIGQLPLSSMEELWQTMISEPYNIEPTMPMYNKRIRILANRQMLTAFLEVMRGGIKHHISQMRHYWALRREYNPSLLSWDSIKLTKLSNRSDVDSQIKFEDSSANPFTLKADNVINDQQREELEVELIKEHRDFKMVSRWFGILLVGQRWTGSGERRLQWCRILLPDAIREFWYYRKRPSFHYFIDTGKVEFDTYDPPRLGTVQLSDLQTGWTTLPGVIVIQIGKVQDPDS